MKIVQSWRYQWLILLRLDFVVSIKIDYINFLNKVLGAFGLLPQSEQCIYQTVIEFPFPCMIHDIDWQWISQTHKWTPWSHSAQILWNHCSAALVHNRWRISSFSYQRIFRKYEKTGNVLYGNVIPISSDGLTLSAMHFASINHITVLRKLTHYT